MKVAISVQGQDLDAPIDPRLGRAAGFLIVDDQSLEFEYLDNSSGVNASHGAGIATARLLADSGAKAVISGAVGPKAHQALSAAGIKLYLAGGAGTARKALEELAAGRLEQAMAANRPGHWQ
jgi:predicted Fe-Mo cluster-binding NifX family protein